LWLGKSDGKRVEKEAGKRNKECWRKEDQKWARLNIVQAIQRSRNPKAWEWIKTNPEAKLG
jgi:hypothetical protein